MRWIAISLLVINLLVAGWFGFMAADPTPEASASGLPELSFNNLRQDARPDTDRPVITTLNQQSAEDEQCAFVGQFTTEQAAASAVDRLASLELSPRIQVHDVPDEPLWWVHIPPLPSEAEAERRLRALSERQIESFLVSEGEFRNAISLGYFRNRTNAMQLSDDFNDDGIDSELREIQRFNQTYWLVFEPEEAGLVSDGSLQSLRSEYPDVELERADCDWLQNA